MGIAAWRKRCICQVFTGHIFKDLPYSGSLVYTLAQCFFHSPGQGFPAGLAVKHQYLDEFTFWLYVVLF
jgi:hypothetical protein